MRDGALTTRVLPDGRELTLYPMLFGNTRLCEGPEGEPFYERGWCFHDFPAAMVAANLWDGEGEPEGFYRRVGDQDRALRGTPT